MSRFLAFVCGAGFLACSATPPRFDDAGVDAAPAIDAPASIDADTTDAASGAVVVHVRRVQLDGQPDTAAVVYHTRPSGELIGMETTGADGSVSLMATAGDAVTVRHGGGFANLRTVVGVAPGDELWFGPPAFAPAGQMTVTVPEHPDGGQYEIRGPCIAPQAQSTTSLLVRWYDGCPATSTVVVVALNAGPSGVDVHFTAPLTVASGGTVALTGTWTEPVPMSLALQGVPSGTRVQVDGALMSGDYTTPYDEFDHDALGQVVHWERPATLDQGTLVALEIEDTGRFEALARLAPGTTTMNVAPRIPTVTDVVESPTIGWTLSSAAPFDGFLLMTESVDGKGQTIARWDFILPPDARTLVRPQIPDPLDTQFLEIVVVDVAGADYAAVRGDSVNLGGLIPRRIPVGHDVQMWQTLYNN